MSASNQTGNNEDKGHQSAKLMEQIISRENMTKAYRRVIGNKGVSGVDGLTTLELKDHLQVHWSKIKAALLEGSYYPQPVKKVTIPKSAGGERILGIPTVVDRMIQQGIHQILRRSTS